jgi:hypothetical protein
MPTLFLTKVLKIYDREKTASSTNIVGKRGYLSIGKDFLNRTPVAQQLKSMDKWDFTKLKSF